MLVADAARTVWREGELFDAIVTDREGGREGREGERGGREGGEGGREGGEGGRGGRKKGEGGREGRSFEVFNINENVLASKAKQSEVCLKCVLLLSLHRVPLFSAPSTVWSERRPSQNR